jgi:hypothetical protein
MIIFIPLNTQRLLLATVPLLPSHLSLSFFSRSRKKNKGIETLKPNAIVDHTKKKKKQQTLRR